MKKKKKTAKKPVRKKATKPRRALKQSPPEQDVEFKALLGELLPRQQDFLKAFYEEGTIAAAAVKIGVSRQAHHDVWMRKDIDTGEYVYKLYSQLFLDARNALVEIAESALWKRGIKGIEEPIVFQGKLTEHKLTKYDTTALIFWLKGNCPEKYKERFEHTGADGGPMSMTIDAARQIADNFDKRHRPNKKKGKT